MASFNSFPIPTVLEQLKNADVDDAIHDIAERKHVFEGPMRLSPGRLYKLYAHVKTAEVLTPDEYGNIYLNIVINNYSLLSSQNVSTSSVNANILFIGELYCLDNKLYAKVLRGSGNIASNQPLTANTYLRVVEANSFTVEINGTNFVDNFDVVDFYLVEV